MESREKQYVRKVDMPEERDAQLAFCNVLHFFRVTNSPNPATYTQMHQKMSGSLRNRYPVLPPGFPVHAGTAAHVLTALLQEDAEHDIRNATGIITGPLGGNPVPR